jgi:hypothetical protein
MRKFRPLGVSVSGTQPRLTASTRFRLLLCVSLIALVAGLGFAALASAHSLPNFFARFVPLAAKSGPPVQSAPSISAPALTAQLNTARHGHTATTLADGRVLVIGGENAGGALNSTEIYDPATRSFAYGGNLSGARAGHAAVRLGDGRVLVSGGGNSTGALASTEIFDPATGNFSSGATMAVARSGHTATVLADGNVLIAGGDGAGGAEIYDASAGSFTALANALTTTRAGHSAALMNDGRVFIVGGADAAGEELNSAEIYNPADGAFTATGGAMAHARTRPTLRLLPDGKVQIIGGNDDLSMEIYDPAIDAIGAHAHLIPVDDEHAALMPSDLLSAPSRAALFHHGQTDPLLDRENHTITELGSQALVAGGADTAGSALDSAAELNSSAAAVTTDKLDYQPGQTAVISGSGWQPGETVDLILHEDPHVCSPERRLTATADENGNFTANYLVEEHDLRLTFIIGAKGQTSGRTAQTTFTDASPGSLGNYATAGLSGTMAPTDVAPSNVAANVSFSNLTRGAGLTAVSTADAFNSSSWQTASALTISGNTDYYEFTITPNSCYQFSASEMRVGLQRSGSGPTQAELRSSLDSYATTIGSAITVGTSLATHTINLSAVSGLQNRTSAVTFRIYGYNASNVAGTLRIQRVTSVPMVGLEVDGTVAAASGGAPSISTHPMSQTKTVGESVTFSVVATGTAPLSYQWRKNGMGIMGATSSSYMIASVVTGDAGSYDVVVSNACGSATSTAATLTVNKRDTATSVSLTGGTNPSTYGDLLTFTATVSGTGAGAGNPSGGSVEFFDGLASLGTQTLSGGTAAVTTSALTAGAHSITAVFTSSDANFNGSASGALSQTVNQKALTGSITAANKTYDSTTAATILTRTLSGVVGTDDVSYVGGTATFDTKNVGTGKTVTATGLSLSGAAAGNYTVNTTAMTTADITAASVTGSFTAAGKTYDGNTSAMILTRNLSGVIGTDDVSLSGGTATFDTKNVGTGKTVTGTGFTLSGADAGNYALASTTLTTTADITARTLNVTATGVNKTYDGTANATVNLSDDHVAGDDITTSYASASFADKHVGMNKPVSVSGISISGADAGNYSLASTTANTTADITALAITVTAVADTKTYDGNTSSAGVPTIAPGLAPGDTAGFVQTFDTANAGMGKTLTPSGAVSDGNSGNNYTVMFVAVNTGVINKADATISVTGYSVTYDGLAHTATGSATGVLGESLAGLDLSGTTHTNAGNYTDNWTFTDVTGNYNDDSGTVNDSIAKADAIIVVNGYTGIYDAASHGATGSATGVQGENLAGLDLGASFRNVPGGTANWTFTDVTGNYNDNSGTAAIVITQRALLITAQTNTKTYDGNTSAAATPTVAGLQGMTDSVTGLSEVYDNRNAGTGKTLSVATYTVNDGNGGGNYLVSTMDDTTGVINALALTGSITAANKTYDGNTSAMILTRTLDGVVMGDVVNYVGGTATFADKNVGTNKTVTATGLSLSGADAGNYSVNTTAMTTADITQRALTVSAMGVNKVYDGTTDATVTLSDDRVMDDMLTTNYASAAFDDKNVGTGKMVSVSGITVTGADAGNYTFNTTATTTADITARPLTVSATGVNKVYDGNTTATVNLSDDRVSGDDITTSYTSATFDDKNVGTGKPVSVSGISISGTDAGNYTFNATAETTADITAKPITGSITAANKTYDGNTSAMILTRTLDGVVMGDVVSYVGGTATFADKNVGTNKTVTATGLSLSGADAGNYSVNTTAMTTADITPATPTVMVTGGTFTYDALPHPASAVATGVLNETVPGSFSFTYTPPGDSTVPVNVGMYSVAAAFTSGDPNYTNANGAGSINITSLATMTSVSVSPNSQQYSDKVSFTATITPGFADMVPAASTVTFKVGTQVMGMATLAAGMSGTLTATLSNVALLEPSYPGNGQMAPTAPGTRTVTAVFSGVNPNFTVNNATTPLTITQENATATYSGAQYFATASSTSTTAQITLSATVVDDADSCRGDIRNAVVEFHRDNPAGPMLGSAAPVGLVNPADTTVGTATTTFSYTLTGSEVNYNGATLTVYAVVKNYYTGVANAETVSVVVPGTDSVNGGGYLVMQSSSGQFAGLTGSKMNFGYTMKYNKSGKNLQGQANIIVRGANGRVYQIKSNAVDSLAVSGSTYPRTGTFTTKANMTDITNPLAPMALGGNLKLQVDMTDAALGGQTDKVGITLWNTDGGLYFTSRWDGIKTVQQQLGGGNISVR